MADETVSTVLVAGDHLAAGAFKTVKTDPGTVATGGQSGTQVSVRTDDMDAASDPLPMVNATGQVLEAGQRVEVTHFPDGRVTVSGLLGAGTSPLGTYRDSALLIPALGEVLAVGGTIPGASYPRWAAACAALAFPYGGNATNVGIPDQRDRMRLGVSVTRALGTTGGEATHVLTSAEMPSHTHPIGEGGFTPGASNRDGTAGGEGHYIRNGGSPLAVGATGSGGAHNNMPPYIAVYIFVQVA